MAASDTISETHPCLTAAESAQYQIGSTGSFAASLPASVMVNWLINPLQTPLSHMFYVWMSGMTYMSIRSSFAR